MESKMVSIIIPVYNGYNTIERCYKSLKTQSLSNREFIFINDGSKDDSIKILRELESMDEEVRVIDKNNGGVSSARNFGLKVARGEYIAFVDIDDYLLDIDYFKNMLLTFSEQFDIDLVISGLTSMTQTGNKKFSVDNKVESIKQFAQNYIKYRDMGILNSPWNKMYRRSKITELFPENMTFGEDAVFVTKYLMNCRNVAFCPGCGYGYEDMNVSTTAEYRKKLRFDMRQTNIYHETIFALWFDKLNKEQAICNYVSLRSNAIKTIMNRILERDGFFGFMHADIDEILPDRILNTYRNFILDLKQKTAEIRIATYILRELKFRLKLFILYEKLRGILRKI